MINKTEIMRYFKLLFLVFFSSCVSKSEKEIYLIPDHFEGKVNVLFDQKEGDDILYENGNRVYRISNDGILATKFAVQEGVIEREYYTYDKKNGRKPLDILIKDNESKKGVKAVFRDGTMGVIGNSNDKNSIVYQEFYITTVENFEKYFSDDSIKSFTKKVDDKILELRAK